MKDTPDIGHLPHPSSHCLTGPEPGVGDLRHWDSILLSHPQALFSAPITITTSFISCTQFSLSSAQRTGKRCLLRLESSHPADLSSLLSDQKQRFFTHSPPSLPEIIALSGRARDTPQLDPGDHVIWGTKKKLSYRGPRNF